MPFKESNNDRFAPEGYDLSNYKALALIMVPGMTLIFQLCLKTKHRVSGYSHDSHSTLITVDIFHYAVVILSYSVHSWVRLEITLLI